MTTSNDATEADASTEETTTDVRVYKYPLYNSYGEPSLFTVPAGSIVLTVDATPSGPAVWMQVDTKADYVERSFAVIQTGKHNVPENGTYVGTAINGRYVDHVYEITAPTE